MEDISKINQTTPVPPDKQGNARTRRKKGKKRKPVREAKKYLQQLTRIVEDTHKELESRGSPVRLCIYQDGDDIYIDIVTIGMNGKIDQVFRHDISHEQLESLVAQIKSGTGLILDADA